MNNEERDTLLIGMGKDIGYIKKRLDDGAVALKEHEKRIGRVEARFGILGTVWILLAAAVSYLYRSVLGVE